MWLHYFLFFTIIILGLICKQQSVNSRKLFLLIVFLMFFILATFRAITVGNDTQEYFRVFNLIRSSSSLKNAIGLTRYEVGFVCLNYITGKYTDNFSVLLGIVSAFYLYSVIRFINKYAKNIPLVVILCFTFSIFYDVMIIERQCIAVGIFLFAIDYIIERKPIKYFVLVVLATLFQRASVFLVLIYFLPRANFNRKKDVYKWIGIIGLSCFGIVFLHQLVQYFLPYYAHYFNTSYGEGGARSASIVFALVRILIVLFVWKMGGLKKYSVSVSDNNVNNVFMQLMMLDCIVAVMSISFNMLDRIENFFCLGYIAIISDSLSQLTLYNKLISKILIVGLTFVYITVFLVFRHNWYGLFPYQFR